MVIRGPFVDIRVKISLRRDGRHFAAAVRAALVVVVTRWLGRGRRRGRRAGEGHERMDAITAYNKQYEFFKDITGEAMRIHRKWHSGLLESAYEAALKYLLEQKGYKVERQKFLPIFWDDVRLDQDYRLDLVVNDNIILELKAVKFVDKDHRRQLFNYMNLTHLPYGMLINFSPDGLYSEWYKRDNLLGTIDRIKLL